MHLKKILFILASMEIIMKRKLCASPHFNYKYLVLALSSSLSLSINANAQNQTQPLTTTLYDSPEAMQPAVSTSNHSSSNHSRILTSPTSQRMGGWLSQEFNNGQNSGLKPNSKSDFKTAYEPYYEPAMVWQSSAEVAPQQTQQKTLIADLDHLLKSKSSIKNNLLPLKQWLQSLAATGRVVLPKQDPRYLEANPSIEPVLRTGDTVLLHANPNTVTVLFDNTQACRVLYEAGTKAHNYIDECLTTVNKQMQADDAYLISPDGTIQYIALAKWNAQTQLPPISGSWLWVPDATNGWTKDLALDVAKFIATQGQDLPLPFGQNDNPISLTVSQPVTSRDLPISSSDWGVVGLLQTPTARMHDQGTLVTHISHVDPYTQYNLLLQPFDRLETTVRYSNIDGVSYGPVSPNQDLKDKSLDVKLKLLKEDRWLPELAVGWRDMAGTSLFAGEYLVASKRYGDFDFSLGMGWGYLGARGNIDNPLGNIDDRFDERVVDKGGEGGELSAKSWFTGPTSLFGGIQWHTPYDPLTLKIEYDGNDYQSEPYSDKNLNTKDFPVNIGATWQDLDRGIAVSAGYERGDTLMLGLTLQGDLSKLGRVKPKAYQVKNIEKLPATQYSNLSYRINLGQGDSDTYTNPAIINAFSQATGWKATDLSITQGNVILNVEDYGGAFIKERLQQGMEVLRQVLPADTNFIQIQVSRYGEPVGVFNIDPDTWSQQYLQLPPPSQRIDHPLTITTAVPTYPALNTQVVSHTELPKGSIRFTPSLQQSIGGPDGYLFGIFANANVDYKLWTGSWVDGTAQVRVVDNYDNYSYVADSNLPRVRTNFGEYMTTSRLLMPNLQWNQFKSFGNNLYGLAYAGYLDPMFAGVGAEILYRKPNQPWAVGVDLNHVRQRDFDQHFGLQDYEATTGNISVYWDTPWYDVDMKVSAGQYLAGDKGATLDLSRQFNNGVKMGGWITKTDVSSEEFGEGSLDKGIYVSIPLDTLFSHWSSNSATLVYQPLIRDGGAKLHRKNELIDLTSPLDKSTLDIKNPLAH